MSVSVPAQLPAVVASKSASPEVRTQFVASEVAVAPPVTIVEVQLSAVATAQEPATGTQVAAVAAASAQVPAVTP